MCECLVNVSKIFGWKSLDKTTQGCGKFGISIHGLCSDLTCNADRSECRTRFRITSCTMSLSVVEGVMLEYSMSNLKNMPIECKTPKANVGETRV